MTCWTWATWFSLGVDVAFLAIYASLDWRMARWLPWYRRYLVSLLWVMKISIYASVWPYAPFARALTGTLAVAVYLWNAHTARRNRDNDRDMRKLEAQQSDRLTEAQQAAFRRECEAC